MQFSCTENKNLQIDAEIRQTGFINKHMWKMTWPGSRKFWQILLSILAQSFGSYFTIEMHLAVCSQCSLFLYDSIFLLLCRKMNGEEWRESHTISAQKCHGNSFSSLTLFICLEYWFIMGMSTAIDEFNQFYGNCCPVSGRNAVKTPNRDFLASSPTTLPRNISLTLLMGNLIMPLPPWDSLMMCARASCSPK